MSIKEIFTSKQDLSETTECYALNTLFGRYYDRLVYFSFQLIKDEHQAEDVVQEAFIKYWDLRHSVSADEAAIKNFLYRTVRNASLNSIRHAKVVAGYIRLHGTEEPMEQSVMEAIISAEVIGGLQAAMQSLPESHRLISELGYLEGKKNQEIADELEMSVNTVKKQKHRALQLLRLKLEPEFFMLLAALLIAAH